MKYILLILSLGVLLISFSTEDREVGDIARIHIVANSDNEKDIETKMKVKDKVVDFLGDKKFSGELEDELLLLVDDIEKEAQKVLLLEGAEYSLTAEVKVKHFDRKTLGYSALPSGEYPALIITLGKGEGHNWWSVIFPEIALSASLSSGEEGSKSKTVIIGGDTILKVRCFLYDLIKTYI